MSNAYEVHIKFNCDCLNCCRKT